MKHIRRRSISCDDIDTLLQLHNKYDPISMNLEITCSRQNVQLQIPDIIYIVSTFQSLATIYFDIYYGKDGDVLCNSLSGLKNVRMLSWLHIYLFDCNISASGLDVLTTDLFLHPNITYLKLGLSCNSIGLLGVQHIARIKSHQSLLYLSLVFDRCHLRDADIQPLSELFSSCVIHVLELNLSCNVITDKGIKLIVQSPFKTGALRKLSMDLTGNTLISDESARALIQLYDISSLKEIKLLLPHAISQNMKQELLKPAAHCTDIVVHVYIEDKPRQMQRNSCR
jgi:hypothetical protein